MAQNHKMCPKCLRNIVHIGAGPKDVCGVCEPNPEQKKPVEQKPEQEKSTEQKYYCGKCKRSHNPGSQVYRKHEQDKVDA